MDQATDSYDVHRARRLMLAYLTTGISKGSGLASQLIALPIVASALTDKRFGAVFVIAAMGSFLSIAGQGFSPAASYVLAAARGRGDAQEMRRLFWTMFAVAAISGTIVLASGLMVSFFVDPVLLVGPESRQFADELRWAMIALTLHATFFYWFWFAEGARAAFQENHVTNIFAMASSVAVLGGVWLAAQFRPTIGTFYLAMFATPSLFQGLSLAHMIFERRRSLGRPVFDGAAAKDIAVRALSYSRAQIGNNLYLQGTVYMAGHIIGLQAGAITGAAIRLFVLIHSLLLSLLVPVLPTFTHGMTIKDHRWLDRSMRTVSLLTVVGPLLVGVALFAGGAVLFRFWLNLDFPEPSLPAFFIALMGAAFMASHLAYMILTALGDPNWGSKRILAAGIVGGAAGLGGALVSGLMSLIAIQACAMLLLATIPLHFRLRAKQREIASTG